jgi:hypothetical protein
MEFFCLPLLSFKEQVHEERVDIVNLQLNINWRHDICYDMHLPVRQKPNLSTVMKNTIKLCRQLTYRDHCVYIYYRAKVSYFR